MSLQVSFRRILLFSYDELIFGCSTDGPSFATGMHAGCVLEESNVASPDVLKRADSRKSRQNLMKRTSSLKHSRGEATEPLLDDNPEEQSGFPYVKLFMLILVWLAFFAVQILQGGKSGAISLRISHASSYHD
jgi:hypothetical protein